jgi:hypothetical protein
VPAAATPTPPLRRTARLVPRSDRASDATVLRAAAGLLVGLGTAPGASAGMTVHVGLRRRGLSLGLEGRADFPASEPVEPRGSVSASVQLLSLVPCLHRDVVHVCALGSVGTLKGVGSDPSGGRTDVTVFGSVGARAGIEIPISAGISARLHGDVAATLTPTTLQVDGSPVWETPPVWGAVGAAAQVHFP